ncbi:MAG: LysM peptidoglycan-binding domain-containing protein [Anaerolineaceae bacterium]|nr:LysM peptidoglycan-binding domain-containing protein [Anaerolineaceae bacterium]
MNQHKPISRSFSARMTALILSASILALTGCNLNLNPGGATPTVQEIPVSDTPEPTRTLPASATLPPQPQIATATPTPTPLPPSETPTPSETPGPYEHVIQQNETLGYIIQLYGYTDFSIIDQIVALNDNIPSADILPGPGSTILIPRQTAIPTPANVETVAANAGPVVTLAANSTIIQYTVQDGDNLLKIIEQYKITLEIISQLNPDLNIFGCDLSNPSGGPNCIVPLSVGQLINVPAPTPTPTLSPTPSGQETATLTPTFAPPIAVFPPEGAIAPPGVFHLQWVGAGILSENEFYLVQITDQTNAASFAGVTKATSLRIPDSLIPTDGQTHIINWTVAVARPNESGVYGIISGPPPTHSFSWQSR